MNTYTPPDEDQWLPLWAWIALFLFVQPVWAFPIFLKFFWEIAIATVVLGVVYIAFVTVTVNIPEKNTPPYSPKIIYNRLIS